MTDANIIEIFCILDEFCKYFAPELKNTRWTSAANVAATASASCPTAR